MRVIGVSSSRLVRGAVLAFGALLAITVPAASAAAADTQQVPLHNIQAPTESGSNCPNAVDDFWHFVATPGSGSFVFESITIVAGNPPTAYTFSGGDIIVNTNSNNVFVKVPTGVDPYSIQLAGSFAVISPATPNANFVLSHYCDGTVTTTTTTTTTDAGTTTTTDAGTTTTTTDAGTTTTTDAGGTTTSSSVAQLPPATTTSTTPLTDSTTTSSSVAQMPPVGPTTTLLVTPITGGNPAVTPALPETGSDAAGQVAIAAAAVLGAGLAIVAASRRRGTVEG